MDRTDSCVHLYCGNGKGKTTASVGLALRACGAGKRVLFTQFFKNGSSSEISALKSHEGVTVYVCENYHGLWHRMDEEQRARAREDYTGLLRRVLSEAKKGYGLLVLDEAVSACKRGIIPESELIDFLKNRPEGLEVVITGREPSDALMEQADYITEMKKLRHPFDRGIAARRGIEF
ncbi:MAG: cob(I)yrinic acid a,c-diamide adenosyltransferase [Oscillospiraceae bacterium]|nr:cob(I)yrinic acid a,c-diamide adenosyltransferase [Oscillospiraceae bacterium]